MPLLYPESKSTETVAAAKQAFPPGWMQICDGVGDFSRILAFENARTIYRVKYDLWDDYLRQQLKAPSVQMCFA